MPRHAKLVNNATQQLLPVAILPVPRESSGWQICPGLGASTAGLGGFASAVQIADTGFNMYINPSRYIGDYEHVGNEVRQVATKVQHTAWALQRLGYFLQDFEYNGFCKLEALRGASRAIDGCRTLYEDVGKLLSRPDLKGSDDDESTAVDTIDSLMERWTTA